MPESGGLFQWERCDESADRRAVAHPQCAVTEVRSNDALTQTRPVPPHRPTGSGSRCCNPPPGCVRSFFLAEITIVLAPASPARRIVAQAHYLQPQLSPRPEPPRRGTLTCTALIRHEKFFPKARRFARDDRVRRPQPGRPAHPSGPGCSSRLDDKARSKDHLEGPLRVSHR